MDQTNKYQSQLAVNKFKKMVAALAIIGTIALSSSGVRANDRPFTEHRLDNDTTHISPIYTKVDMQPQFPGGLEAFGMFLGKNIHYPADDAKNKTQGKVIVKFVVEQNGSISNITVISSPTKAMADEATRVLALSPLWHPGYQNGHTVRVWYAVPINFAL